MLLSRLSTLILNLLGWTVRADIPDTDKYIIIAAPHTSNWDFPLGIMAAWAMNVDIRWMGKHTLFRWPIGWFFRALGGVPVHRGQAQNLIQQMTELFAHSDKLVLALAPEGTRRKTNHWKTGFHYIARVAQVPIVMGYLDFGNRQVGISGAFYPSDDIEADFSRIRQFYQHRRGHHPEKESLIRVRNVITKG